MTTEYNKTVYAYDVDGNEIEMRVNVTYAWDDDLLYVESIEDAKTFEDVSDKFTEKELDEMASNRVEYLVKWGE